MLRTKSAFTLIELLVVIAIIAILAAILFPVFATAREKARQSACSSNLKQLGLAFVQYTQDYDETPPCGVSGTNQILGWAGQLYPYVKSRGVFVCPDDTTIGASCSYGINRSMLKVVTYSGAHAYPVWPISQYTSPARTVVLFEVTGSAGYDVSNSNSNTSLNDDGTGYSGYSPSGSGVGAAYDPFTNNLGTTNLPCNVVSSGTCSTNSFTLKYAIGYQAATPAAYQIVFASKMGLHSTGANFLAADGHVKWCLPTTVSGGDANPTSGDCNPSFTMDPASGNVFPFAANTSCASPSIALTFSVL